MIFSYAGNFPSFINFDISEKRAGTGSAIITLCRAILGLGTGVWSKVHIWPMIRYRILNEIRRRKLENGQ